MLASVCVTTVERERQSLLARLSVFNTVRQNELINHSSVGIWRCQLSLTTAAMIWQRCQTMMGEKWMISRRPLRFSADFGLWVRFKCIPYFRQSCGECPQCQDKSTPSVVEVDGFGLDMHQWMWVYASHAGRKTQTHLDTPAFWLTMVSGKLHYSNDTYIHFYKHLK